MTDIFAVEICSDLSQLSSSQSEQHSVLSHPLLFLPAMTWLLEECLYVTIKLVTSMLRVRYTSGEPWRWSLSRTTSLCVFCLSICHYQIHNNCL